VVVVAFARNSVFVVHSGLLQKSRRRLAVAEIVAECFRIRPHRTVHRLAETFAQACCHRKSYCSAAEAAAAAAAAECSVQISLLLAIVYCQTVRHLVEAVAEDFVQIDLYFVTVYFRQINHRFVEAERFHQTTLGFAEVGGCRKGWTYLNGLEWCAKARKAITVHSESSGNLKMNLVLRCVKAERRFAERGAERSDNPELSYHHEDAIF
jgi:hypothetical protein